MDTYHGRSLSTPLWTASSARSSFTEAPGRWILRSWISDLTEFSEVRAGILDGSFAADMELRWPVQGPEIIRRYTEADRHDDRARQASSPCWRPCLLASRPMDCPTPWAVRTPDRRCPPRLAPTSATPPKASRRPAAAQVRLERCLSLSSRPSSSLPSSSCC
jgi:hypothetical protein